MPKGFAYKYPTLRDTDDQVGLTRIILDNFRESANFINAYIPTYEQDGTTLSLSGDLNVVGDLTYTGDLLKTGAREFCHVYKQTGTDATAVTTWETVPFDTEDGTSSTIFTFDAANNEIDISGVGVYLAIGQVNFSSVASGYLRLRIDGTSEVGRGVYDNVTDGQVTGIFALSGAASLTLETFTAAAETINVGIQARYLKVVRLFSL